MIAWWSGLKFDEGTLHPETERVFRIDGESITLFRHQLQAVAKAAARQSFVVTTGTGSGKSLCFSVPIIDSAIRARIAGETQPDTSSSDGGSRLLEAPCLRLRKCFSTYQHLCDRLPHKR